MMNPNQGRTERTQPWAWLPGGLLTLPTLLFCSHDLEKEQVEHCLCICEYACLIRSLLSLLSTYMVLQYRPLLTITNLCQPFTAIAY